MTEVEPNAPARTVLVSSEVLARICPERGAGADGPLRRHPRLGSILRCRLRLLRARLLFRLGEGHPLRCRIASARLRLRLFWVRLRHARRLS